MQADLLPTSPLSQLFMNLPLKSSLPSASSTQTFNNKLPQGTKIIGNYLLGKNIGQGTFGKVHLAMHIPTSQKVAIKIIDKAKMRPKDVQRVKCEIQILKTVKHRHVLELYEIIETEKSLLLVTEFLPNGQLFRHIIKKKKIPQDQGCVFFQQIIEAVQYLHRNRVAHRDLKPENILIDYDRQLKVIDFGLSSFYDERNQLKNFCGSPCYAAPEMIEAKRSYNPLYADIWSCGIILFAMLCGHLPFCDADTHTLFKKIMTCSYKIPSHVSPQAQDLIGKLLVLAPNKRLTLAQIKDHKWFNRVSPRISYGLNRGQQLQADESILSRMRTMGIDEEKVRICVEKNQKAKDVATYFILMKKMAKTGELIPSYIGSDHFNPQFIKSQEKMGDQPYTESCNDPYNNLVVIESPDAPEIPTLIKGKEAQAVDDKTMWYSKAYNEEEPREIDEGELMLLANSILDIFMPKQTAPSAQIQRIIEVISPTQGKDNPLKKLIMEKRDHQFYQNNEEIGKKRLNLHLQRKLTKNNGDQLTEIPSKTKIKVPVIRIKAASQLKQSVSKRQKTEKRENIMKGASEGFISDKLESNSSLPTKKNKEKIEEKQRKQSTIEKKLEFALPILPKKYDPKIQTKIRQITKQYKIYRAFIH